VYAYESTTKLPVTQGPWAGALDEQRSLSCCDVVHQDLKHEKYPWNTARRVLYSTEKDNLEDKKRWKEEEGEEEKTRNMLSKSAEGKAREENVAIAWSWRRSSSSPPNRPQTKHESFACSLLSVKKSPTNKTRGALEQSI
jgi:hypothetical protein